MALFNRVNVIRDKEGNLRTDFNIQNANTLTNGVYSVALKKGGGAVPVTMGVPDQWVQQADGKWKYRENGSYVCGRWDKIANLWYYFHNDGIMAANKWVENNGNWYYVHGKGNMAVSDWIKWNDDWYYLDKDGKMVKGLRKEINGKWYYFHGDGIMAENETIHPSTGKYYDADGNGVLKQASGDMVFNGQSWLELAEGNYPYIYSTKDKSHSPWTGNFNASADLTFGIGHSIKTASEFNTIKNFIANRSASVISTEVQKYLQSDLAASVNRVNDFIKSNHVKLKQNQFDAIVSLVYNYPSGLTKSSDLGKELISNGSSGNYVESNIIKGFTYTFFQGSRIDGLVTRRDNELNLFLNADYNHYYDTKQKVINAGIDKIQY